MRVLIAPQELKGTLTALEAATAIRDALAAAWPSWRLDLLPMADGGPGTASALIAATGGETRRARTHDPLLRAIDAEWALLADGTAVVECAAASGLWRLAPAERDPLRATSFGTGELIAAALATGCRRLLVGLGGSATNDGGSGLATALGVRLFDAYGLDLPPGGAALASLDHIDIAGLNPAVPKATFIGLTDVTNPLCGLDGASTVFGPQKGADAAAVAELDAALERFADVVRRDLGIAVRDVPGSGAAGGLGAGLLAFLGAELRSGAAAVGEAAGAEARVAAADLVVTGEGRLDGQSTAGKATQYVAALARRHGRPALCLAGSLGPGHQRMTPWFDVIETLGEVEPRELPSKEVASGQLGAAAVRGVLRLLAARRVGV